MKFPSMVQYTTALLAWIVLSSCPIGADVIVADAAHPVGEGSWALKIVQKEFDSSTGLLSIQVANTSEGPEVTAFGVAAVYAREGGSGGTKLKVQEMLPEGGLAPGETYEVKFAFGPAKDSASNKPALKAVLHFEILSDTTSHGNQIFVEEIFESRAHLVREVESTISRLHEVQGGVAKEGRLEHFWAEESRRRREAREALADATVEKLTRTDRARLEAIDAVTHLSEQFHEKVASGESPAQAVSDLRWLLREYYLEPLSAGIRQSDLEKAYPAMEQETE